MKSRLFLSLLSVIAVTLFIGAVPVQAAGQISRDAGVDQLKADDNRTNKLRHGYIKHAGDKVYYYW